MSDAELELEADLAGEIAGLGLILVVSGLSFSSKASEAYIEEV